SDGGGTVCLRTTRRACLTRRRDAPMIGSAAQTVNQERYRLRLENGSSGLGSTTIRPAYSAESRSSDHFAEAGSKPCGKGLLPPDTFVVPTPCWYSAACSARWGGIP